jgi:hypothetical protein
MKTSIANKLDYLANSHRLTEVMAWKLIDELFVSNQDLIDTVNYFIANVQRNHSIPAKDWEKMVMIAQWVDEHQTATEKQKRVIGVLLGLYWNELSAEKNPCLLF